MDKIVLELLRKNNINSVTKAELKFQISSHPSYPSLHAITGVLDHFGIENMALDIPQNNEVYVQLPKYFIAQIKINEENQIALIEKTDTIVKVLYATKKVKLTKKQFLLDWTGIVVVIDEEELSTVKPISNTKISNYLPLAALTAVIVYAFYNFINFSFFSLFHLLFSIIGVYVSVLLIKHELGINSESVSKLCTSSEKTSCDAVLNSKAATLFGLFKLSDVSFVYFVSIVVALVTLLLANNNLNIISLVSLSALPVIAYSIYYQGVIIKKWCPLCLATGSVLLVQSLISYLLIPLNFSFEIKGILILITSFLTVTILYSNIKPIISSKLDLIKSKIEYFKFKRNFSLFNSLYNNKPILNTSINDLKEITFGNDNAKINLVAITNPMCGYCKATHQTIDKLLNSNNNDFKATIRFNISTDDKENISYKIANILLNLYQKDKVACKEAMHQIYTNDVDVNKWIAMYKKNNKLDFYQILNTEEQWCIDNNINFTPAVYINNKEYPKEYDLSDLSFFIDDIIEEENNKSTSNSVNQSNSVISAKVEI